MGPFWAGLAAYHFLPLLTAEGKAPRSFDAASDRHRFAPCFLR